MGVEKGHHNQVEVVLPHSPRAVVREEFGGSGLVLEVSRLSGGFGRGCCVLEDIFVYPQTGSGREIFGGEGRRTNKNAAIGAHDLLDVGQDLGTVVVEPVVPIRVNLLASCRPRTEKLLPYMIFLSCWRWSISRGWTTRGSLTYIINVAVRDWGLSKEVDGLKLDPILCNRLGALLGPDLFASLNNALREVLKLKLEVWVCLCKL